MPAFGGVAVGLVMVSMVLVFSEKCRQYMLVKNKWLGLATTVDDLELVNDKGLLVLLLVVSWRQWPWCLLNNVVHIC